MKNVKNPLPDIYINATRIFFSTNCTITFNAITCFGYKSQPSSRSCKFWI